MRSKLNTTLVLAALGLFSIATACGDDNGTGSPGKGDAGESSSGSGGDGATSAGGSAASGNGGTSNGGDPAVNGGSGGDPAVGGSSSGNGGEPSANAGESGGGGMPTGLGGEAGGGGAAAGAAGAGGDGPVTCTPITLGAFSLGNMETTYANYGASFTPNLGAAATDTFLLSIQGPPDYDGDETGTFDLSQNGDDNYKTCARCILAVEDPGADRTLYYVSEGTLVIDAASTQLTGNIDATVTNLKLIEVTIDDQDLTSTPVPNGKCLTVASADIVVITGAPAGWTCDPDFYGDSECECGCGVKDVDCTSTTDTDECEYCAECSGNFEPCGDDEVDPADTTMCL
jgi:hypothetical protein